MKLTTSYHVFGKALRYATASEQRNASNRTMPSHECFRLPVSHCGQSSRFIHSTGSNYTFVRHALATCSSMAHNLTKSAQDREVGPENVKLLPMGLQRSSLTLQDERVEWDDKPGPFGRSRRVT